MINPYKVLNVSNDATIDDIKKAYRNLAKKYHPDLNPGREKKSEEKFKEILYAYKLIGTAQAKSKFDQGMSEEQIQQQHQKQYEEYMKSQGNQTPHGNSYYDTQQNGGRYSSNFRQSFDAEDIFEQFFKNKKSTGTTREDELYKMEVDFVDAVLGGEKIITLPSGKNLQVKIPAGIEEGQKLKFKNLGLSNGDVYVQINIKALEGFTRAGHDIYTDLSISFFEAISGATIDIPTIDGNILLNVHPGVTTGTRLRVKNKGVKMHGLRGNQIVTIKVVMPKEVKPLLQEAIQKIEKDFSYNPRTSI
ncbi:MAG: hypothetical protein A2381_11635 [Bdellovibrionales bacterium RIFOXYB1_FULL_37_110]|nr:MAG: hypothetical protein A2417_11940 [Bdellovibrionales bacterium RIFOXYC1_FULL_37_79]OFZ57340.1 MAG: hypothetical protein A2381_11635 [Bdellovibrionales bacterium RIFOXYB1_FULL_37_110]OFZ62236.1 MAG: hypothetical protein A2577_14185 [Bdellovibrionales bacterium RIFOXYD1_FULL_36_51]